MTTHRKTISKAKHFLSIWNCSRVRIIVIDVNNQCKPMQKQ